MNKIKYDQSSLIEMENKEAERRSREYKGKLPIKKFYSPNIGLDFRTYDDLIDRLDIEKGIDIFDINEVSKILHEHIQEKQELTKNELREIYQIEMKKFDNYLDERDKDQLFNFLIKKMEFYGSIEMEERYDKTTFGNVRKCVEIIRAGDFYFEPVHPEQY